MNFTKFFRNTDSMPPGEIRDFIGERSPDCFSVVDVRRPDEYRSGHLPGSRLIPLDELSDRLGELDPRKPIIVYCASGLRSRAAVSILARAGFAEVYDMEGGIRAWRGGVVDGLPEAGMLWFGSATSVQEILAIAWLMEEGTRLFFLEIAAVRDGEEAAMLFRTLAAAEHQHGKAVLKLYGEFSGNEPGADFPSRIWNLLPEEQFMEGGMRLAEALSWAEKRDIKDILELAISLESSAYDRFSHMRERFEDEKVRSIFNLLAAEEKVHLESLTRLFEKRLGRLPG